MFTATVIGLAALLILIFIVEVVLRKSRRQNSADGEVTPCQSGDSAPADGTTTHPAGGHHHTPTRPPTQVDTTAAIPMKVASRDMADLMGEAEGMDIEQRPDAVITAPGN